MSGCDTQNKVNFNVVNETVYKSDKEEDEDETIKISLSLIRHTLKEN